MKVILLINTLVQQNHKVGVIIYILRREYVNVGVFMVLKQKGATKFSACET